MEQQLEQQIVYIYCARSKALIKAQEKYRQQNKDKFASYSAKWLEKMKQNPEYIEKRKQYLKEQYQKKKALNQILNENLNK
jgi:hypothetical protein